MHKSHRPPLCALEPTNCARRGHPTTVPYPKMSSKGRTKLQICLSEAKNVVEAAGNVRFRSNPPKRSKNIEKRICETEKIHLHHPVFRGFVGGLLDAERAGQAAQVLGVSSPPLSPLCHG